MRLIAQTKRTKRPRFQSTHPHGVRLIVISKSLRQFCFNPRTRTGCDLVNDFININIISFNPRTRTGCDDASIDKTANSISFNPRTRTGCDSALCIYLSTLHVSIHAPARGATWLSTSVLGKARVSIHAPARGATFKCYTAVEKLCRFNPRTRTGCDKDYGKDIHNNVVSIHAPARGATVYSAMS